MKMSKTLLRPFISGITFLITVFSCTKSNENINTLLDSEWAYTASHGTITVNGNPLGLSAGSSSNRDVLVSFQQNGKYNFKTPVVPSETDGFSLTDSTILLNTDNSHFANFCAYPLVTFGTSTDLPVLTLYHVSNSLNIVYISRDSLLIKTELVKPGNNAPDTIYTEYTGFRKG